MSGINDEYQKYHFLRPIMLMIKYSIKYRANIFPCWKWLKASTGLLLKLVNNCLNLLLAPAREGPLVRQPLSSNLKAVLCISKVVLWWSWWSGPTLWHRMGEQSINYSFVNLLGNPNACLWLLAWPHNFEEGPGNICSTTAQGTASFHLSTTQYKCWYIDFFFLKQQLY